MAGNETFKQLIEHESIRVSRFGGIWSHQLDHVFSEIAPNYDQASILASLGLWNPLRHYFLSRLPLKSVGNLLDVCAGNMDLIRRLKPQYPHIGAVGLDRNLVMLQQGWRQARAKNLDLACVAGDAHALPFPEACFDMVVMQFSGRHVHLLSVFGEIFRVLRPGGVFYHLDLMRPDHPAIRRIFMAYLRWSLGFTAAIVGSSKATKSLKSYFLEALDLYYTVPEMSRIMQGVGFEAVRGERLLLGTVGLHCGKKPEKTEASPAHVT